MKKTNPNKPIAFRVRDEDRKEVTRIVKEFLKKKGYTLYKKRV